MTGYPCFAFNHTATLNFHFENLLYVNNLPKLNYGIAIAYTDDTSILNVEKIWMKWETLSVII
jgi:hypothetical protein